MIPLGTRKILIADQNRGFKILLKHKSNTEIDELLSLLLFIIIIVVVAVVIVLLWRQYY